MMELISNKCVTSSLMNVSERDDLTGKLIPFLKKITDYKKFDSIYTEKLLVSINKEFSNTNEYIHEPGFSEWLSETFQKWKRTNPNVAEAIFICKFIGIVTKNKQGFQFLLNCNALTQLTSCLQSHAFEHTALTPAYICFLTDILTHKIGYEWLKNTRQWKTVSKLYFSNSNLYVEREGLNFLKTFISKVVQDDEGSKEILQEIFLFLNKYSETNLKDQKFSSVILLFLKLLQSLLEAHIFSKNSFFFNKLVKVLDLQLFLNFLLENCEQEIIIEKASVLQIICFVFQYEDKKKLLCSKDLSTVTDSFCALIKKNQFNGIIKLAKYCQVLWSKMRKEMKCESETGVQCIIMQLLPALMCTQHDTSSHDIHIQKLFSLITTRAQKFCHLLSNEIRNKVSLKPKNLALKGILSVTSNSECLNSEEAAIIFQTMAYILNSFILNSSYPSTLDNFNDSERETFLNIQDTKVLSAVLNSLCVLIEKFRIRWSETLESLCLFKITCALLENPNLPPIVVVQVFLLLKLAILNSMSPDLRFLSKITKNSSFDWLMSLLFKRLHDPNWEIRDSCLEVVTAIAELSESENPTVVQLLVEKNFCSAVFDIMEGDSESYVRASAIQTLTAIIKIKHLNQYLISMDIPRKITQLLQNESEAIVRREAALMIKQLYLALNESHDEIAASFYEVMGYSAICDLHWEVKVNSLIFWEAVIQRIIADQGSINRYIPKVTFSKEKNDVKSKLDKILTKLSEIGCLYVLLTTLNDDYDMPVIRKSAQILSELMDILEHYEPMEFLNDIPIGDRIPMKRKNTVLDSSEKRKTLISIAGSNWDGLGEINSESLKNKESASSDVVIDEIVNEMDINLLDVCFQKDQTVSLQKKMILQKVRPETFLLKIKNFNFEKFLEDKQKWLVNVEVDFKSLLPETVNLTDETNVMDCY